MTAEGMLFPRAKAFVEAITTKAGIKKIVRDVTTRHEIQEIGGELVSIQTPSGTVLTIRNKDRILIKGARNSNEVIASFDLDNLPPGYLRLSELYF